MEVCLGEPTRLKMSTAGRLHCRLNFHIKYGGLHDGFVLSRSESNFSFFVEILLKENYKITRNTLKHVLMKQSG